MSIFGNFSNMFSAGGGGFAPDLGDITGGNGSNGIFDLANLGGQAPDSSSFGLGMNFGNADILGNGFGADPMAGFQGLAAPSQFTTDAVVPTLSGSENPGIMDQLGGLFGNKEGAGVLPTLGGLASAYGKFSSSKRQNDLLERSLDYQQKMGDINLKNQTALTNTAMRDKQRGYLSSMGLVNSADRNKMNKRVDEYMSKNAI